MRKIALMFAFGLTVLTLQAKQRPDSVYICLGKYSHAFHRNNFCKGLRNCKAKLIYISLSDAVNKYGRKACGYCYK